MFGFLIQRRPGPGALRSGLTLCLLATLAAPGPARGESILVDVVTIERQEPPAARPAPRPVRSATFAIGGILAGIFLEIALERRHPGLNLNPKVAVAGILMLGFGGLFLGENLDQIVTLLDRSMIAWLGDSRLPATPRSSSPGPYPAPVATPPRSAPLPRIHEPSEVPSFDGLEVRP